MQEDTSKDDKLTETEALEMASQDGIEFEDRYYIVKQGSYSPDPSDTTYYQTKEEAETALQQLPNSQELTIIQSRSQKH